MEHLITEDIYDVYSMFWTIKHQRHELLYVISGQKIFWPGCVLQLSGLPTSQFEKAICGQTLIFSEDFGFESISCCQKVPFEVYIKMDIYLFFAYNNDSGWDKLFNSK